MSRPFVAGDGSIVRLRTGGLPVSVESLTKLMDGVGRQPDSCIQLTSRGALQVRGLPDPLPERTRAAIAATGLVPSPSHELVRNVVVSPLTGLDGGGTCDLRPVVAALDEGLCRSPELARLPGRFLFALDDGRGDVIDEAFDVAYLATGPQRGVVLAGTTHRGWRTPLHQAVPALLGLAHQFLAARDAAGSDAWHVDELPVAIGPERDTGITVPQAPARPIGVVGDHAVVGVPLGLLTTEHLHALASVTSRVGVTPWRSLVIEKGAVALDRLAAAGLVTDTASPWFRLHACTGRPGCSRSAIDTRALAHDLAPRLPAGTLPVHISGCERRCGAPQTAFADLLAPASTDEALDLVLSSRT